MFCYKCGAKNPDGANYCGSCGVQIQQQPAQQTINMPPPVQPMPTVQYPGQYPGCQPDDHVLKYILPVGRSGWAIAAGYAGLFSVLLLPGPIAIILSLFAIFDTQNKPWLAGKGRAIFGLVMGILGTIGLLICFVAMLGAKSAGAG